MAYFRQCLRCGDTFITQFVKRRFCPNCYKKYKEIDKEQENEIKE